jgi:2-iminobutanoate/2-iminopropanoate deaminase
MDGAKPLARYSAWKRRGDFIFLSGVIPVDPVKKLIVRGFDDLPEEWRAGEFSVDLKDGPIQAQSYMVMKLIEATMRDAGGSMKDVFKLVQYFKHLDQFPRYNQVRRRFFADDPPVSTVVEVSGLMPHSDVLIEVEATAWLPA